MGWEQMASIFQLPACTGSRYAQPVIVVIGSPVGRLQDGDVVPTGNAARVALAAARAGASVQVVGRIGDDQVADEILLNLGRGGVGHVALLRDPALLTPIEVELTAEDVAPSWSDATNLPSADSAGRPTLDAADVDLGLRYLNEFAVLVLAEPAGHDVVRVVVDAATWHAARLLVVVEGDATRVDGFPADAIVFEAPADDRDGVFANFVGTFAAALDDGTDPAEAFRSSIAAEGWTEATPD